METARSRIARLGRLALVFAACAKPATAPVDTGSPLPPGLTLRQEAVVSGLSSPLFLTAPLNDGRIFIVEQEGRVRILRNGQLQAVPFLDISSRISGGGERGLLSVAFHPQYATNRYFYVYDTAPNGDVRIERYTAATEDFANPLSVKLILTIPHSTFSNHNGGLATFGPDGLLYLGVGDGGSGGDPSGNGQNFNVLLASMLRIDVDHGDPYAIPPGNPFVGQSGKRGELWAKGLRNPWRYAFDPPTGLLYIADVGQNQREEVSVVPATSGGLNFGWNTMEGLSCYNATSCSQAGLTLPVLDYSHAEGCSITGGYVYRGSAIPALRGHYFYADFCGGALRSFRYENGAAVDRKSWTLTPPLGAVTSFGQDASGELYLMWGGTVWRIVAGS